MASTANPPVEISSGTLHGGQHSQLLKRLNKMHAVAWGKVAYLKGGPIAEESWPSPVQAPVQNSCASLLCYWLMCSIILCSAVF